VTFRLPASAIKVELRHHQDQWTLAYLGLSSVGLEGVDEAIFHFEAGATPETVAGYIEWRLEEAGCHPVRANRNLLSPVVAAWRV
jgi:hypothetical protein